MAGAIGSSARIANSVQTGHRAAHGILTASRNAQGVINTHKIAAGIAYLAVRDPKAAATTLADITPQLNAAQKGALSRELGEAIRAEQRGLQTTPAGLTPQQKELALDLGQIGLDIVGLVDPTPVSDGLNGIISLFRGDFLGAGISAVSMIPYIGDAAKLGKLGKWSKSIERAIDVASAAPNTAAGKALRPAIAKIADGLNAIPASVLNKLPAGARNQILDMRAKANAFLGVAGKTFSAAVNKTASRLGIPPQKVQDVLDAAKGSRPDPSAYMTKAQIKAHLAKFDDGIVRFTSRAQFQKYGTLGPSPSFALPKSELSKILNEAKGDMRLVETRLGLDRGTLSSGDTMIVLIERKNVPDLKVPNGNERGANDKWLPGGVTSGGVSEATLSLPKNLPFKEIRIN
jgi:hypothetical protein